MQDKIEGYHLSPSKLKMKHCLHVFNHILRPSEFAELTGVINYISDQQYRPPSTSEEGAILGILRSHLKRTMHLKQKRLPLTHYWPRF